MSTLRVPLCSLLIGALVACGAPQARVEAPAIEDEPSARGRVADRFASPDLWSTIVFGGEGLVEFTPTRDATPPTHRLTLDLGDPLTGVRYVGELDPLFGATRESYRLEVEARRVRGNDFFCGVTFPIGQDQHATLILGGWGGSLAGLSSLDGFDASQNGTTQYRKFERNRWYHVAIEVRPRHIEVTLDDEPLFTVDRRNVGEFSVRAEVLPTVPFGLCTFMTEGEWRRLRVQPLPARNVSEEG